jgi:hypothetical protein
MKLPAKQLVVAVNTLQSLPSTGLEGWLTTFPPAPSSYSICDYSSVPIN